MKRTAFIAAAFVFAAGFTACSSETPAPAADPTPAAPSSLQTPEAATAEQREALAAAQAFFAAFEARDRARILGTLSASWTTGAEFASELGGTTAVRLVSLSLDKSRPTAPGTILVVATMDVTPGNVPTNWNPGRNTRLLQLVNEGGAWKVAAFGG